MRRPDELEMKPCIAFHMEHSNGDHFLIAKDYFSGRNRFTTFVWRVGRNAKIIGRELTLAESRQIVDAYPMKPILRPRRRCKGAWPH